MVTAMILEVVKTGEAFSPFLTGKLCYHCNAWITGVYMAYMFDRNSGGKTSQIEWLFELNLRSFSYFKCSTALWLWLGASGPGFHQMPKMGHLQKKPKQNRSCI